MIAIGDSIPSKLITSIKIVSFLSKRHSHGFRVRTAVN